MHGLESPQGVPFGALTPATHSALEQVEGVQTSPPHLSPLGSAVPATQLPAPLHCSVPLHGLPSEHDVPAGRLRPVQTPAWQVSVWVQALPSLQVVPLTMLDHAVVEVAGVHAWQALVGCGSFGA